MPALRLTTLLRVVLFAPIICWLAMADTHGVGAQSTDGHPPGEWVHLGPAGAVVQRIAVTPTWPSDRTLAALTQTSLLLTSNGGLTWSAETLPSREGLSPGASMQSTRLAIAPRYRGVHAIFLVWGDLWRTVDGGRTWERALQLNQNHDYTVRLTYSPAFTDDGTALVLNGEGILSMTRDGGSSWTRVEPVEGQYVQQAEFAPDYGASKTLITAVAGGPFQRIGYEGTPAQATYHSASAGIVVSDDGGLSWQVRSNGLELDAVPYRYVNAIAVSPTFESDGTIFAHAWGPLVDVPPEQRSNSRPLALFRSTDRGMRWSSVWQRPAPAEDRSGLIALRRYAAQIALWPDFQQSGRGQLSLSSTHGGPSGSDCIVLQTASHGATWEELKREPRFPGCPLAVVGTGSTPLLLGRSGYRSLNGGITWEAVGPPGYFGNSIVVASLAAAPDGTIFLAGHDGIWALSPDSRPSPAQVP